MEVTQGGSLLFLPNLGGTSISEICGCPSYLKSINAKFGWLHLISCCGTFKSNYCGNTASTSAFRWNTYRQLPSVHAVEQNNDEQVNTSLLVVDVEDPAWQFTSSLVDEDTKIYTITGVDHILIHIIRMTMTCSHIVAMKSTHLTPLVSGKNVPPSSFSPFNPSKAIRSLAPVPKYGGREKHNPIKQLERKVA